MEESVYNLRRQRPGAGRGGSRTTGRNSSNKKSRHDRSKSTSSSATANFSWKHQLGMVALSTVLWGIWYATPLSDILLELVLEHVPLQADKDLEKASLQQVQVTTYHDTYWTPLVQEIGQDLIQTLQQSCQRQKKNNNNENEGDDDLLCRFSERRSWNFGLVDEPHVVNAFCFPAGTIRITTGLIEKLVPSRGELAALLGHEMGHVLRRHASKRLLAQNVMQKVWQTLHYEDHDGYDESWGEALGELLLDSAIWLGQQRFSRRDEYQADAVSWALLQRSTRYSPLALIRLLEQLQSLEGDQAAARRGSSSSSWATTLEDWSRTHPATADRIQALRDEWAELPLRTRQKYEARSYS